MSAYSFFFSRRRRHTRFKCDWSSDVCSSDLADGRPLQVVVDHVAAHDQVVGVRLDPMTAVVPVAADGAGRGQAVAAAVATDRGEGARLAVEGGHAGAQPAAHDSDQADPAADVQDVAVAQAPGAAA